MKEQVLVFENTADLYRAAAAAVARTIDDAVRRAGRCALALAGGNTPRGLYRALAGPAGEGIPWHRLHLFWGDERYVPHDDPRSNYGMVRETLLDHVACPPSNVHPVPTSGDDPAAAAREYESTLGAFFAPGPVRFDLVLLGLGPDGHTASLFPGSSALDERTRLVAAVTGPDGATQRVTLTPPALRSAEATFFLVAGSKKSGALEALLSGAADPRRHPAAGVLPPGGTVTWWVDREAAGAAAGRREANR